LLMMTLFYSVGNSAYVIPIDFKNGLPYIKMEYPTDDDLKDLPQVILTSDVPWDPRRYDLNRSDQATVLGSHGLPPAIVSVHEGFNQFGEILNVDLDYADTVTWGGNYDTTQVFTDKLSRLLSERFHERLADELRAMGFVPCYGETDIWMRAMNPDGTAMEAESDVEKEDPAFIHQAASVRTFEGYYEYIATYVDDLIIASKDPMAIIRHLEEVPKFKLRVIGPFQFSLGCDFFLDEEGIFDENDTKVYQSLISALKWIVSLGRFDIAVHVMSLSSNIDVSDNAQSI